MKTKKSFTLNPLSASLKWGTILPLLLASTHSLARIIDNDTLSIDGNVATDNYRLINNASLIANGATTDQIRAERGSSLTLNGSTVTSGTTSIAIDLLDSSATIAGSNIAGTSTGLSLASARANPQGSSAIVSGSTISGGDVGAVVSGLSQLDLDRTVLSGTNAASFGLQLANGRVSATASTIRGGLNGILLTTDQTVSTPGRLVLNGTTVQGQTGAAILVDDFGLPATTADIHVGNGSTLVGGNGNILEVKGSSTANMTVDNSHLVGDVVADSGATANVTLQNLSTLTGRLENVSNLAINSQAQWNMVDNGSVENLSMDGGAIKFGSPTEFYKLSVDNLSGNGTFIMDADFSTGNVDTLEVTGTATGNHKILMGSSGADPTGAGNIPVIHIAAGDAQFSMLNGPVDLGTYSYDLIKQGENDWYLNIASRVISPGTRSVLALFNTAPTVWYGELSTLRSRMGEVRRDGNKAGGWIRAYGNKFDVSASSGVGYQQTQQGLSFGADAPLPMGDGQWLVGLLGGYSKSDLDLSRGTSGTVNSYYLGAYTTWLDDESGYYFDGVLKFNRFQNESKVQLSDGKKTKGDYDNHSVGGSLEFGRHIALADGYFVEPYTQLSGVIIQGKNYHLDNGLSAEGDRTHSLLGKVGATAGRNFDLGEGQVVQPYVRVAYAHEFAKNNEVQVNNNKFNNDLSGSRGELGAGVSMTLTDRVSMHADLDYSNGDKIEQPWGVNFGVRYRW